MAGCSSGASSSASPPASPRAEAASAAASADASATASSAASAKRDGGSVVGAASASASASSTAPAACPTSSLSAKAGLAQGTAGSIYQVIDFTNISNAPCTLYGYPGVSLASGVGTPVTQVGAAASRSTATAATLVTLGPGQTASALLRIVEAGNYPPATCTPTTTTYLQIYPPNQTTPIYLGYKSTGCASSSVNLLSVSVVTPGTGG